MRSTLLACLAAVVGCNGGTDPVVVHPVVGEVTYGGRPAAGVQVFLLPTSAPGVPDIPANPRGVTDRAGKFQLTTFAGHDGAAAGGYQVVLLWPPDVADGEEADGDRLLGWYDAVHTKLAVEVKDGANQLKPFALPVRTQPPAASEGVPGRN